MEKQFWLDMWQEETQEFNQLVANPHLINFLPQLGLGTNARIFVPLCGKSVDMVWLHQQGYQVIGCELSAKACEEFFEHYPIDYQIKDVDGFKLYQAVGLEIWCGDYFTLNQQLGTIDAVYDRAALIALPPTMRSQYVEHMQQLAPGCPILLLAVTYDQNEMAGPPFSVPNQEIETLYGQNYQIEELIHFDFPTIPEHFTEKGLTQASEQVYMLKNK